MRINFPLFTKPWILAARPKTLLAALSPVLLGGAFALADELFSPIPFVLALLCSLLFQILANFANDYFDGVKKIDQEDRLGPPRMVAMGMIQPRSMIIAIALLICLLVVLGVLLFLNSGWPVVVIGLAAILSAIFYSGGPLPYASRALGDVFAFVFFGPVAVLGSYFVQAHNLNASAGLASLGTGLWITAILVVNNYRDRKGDKQVGKYTMAVILGEKKSRCYFYLLLGLSFLVPPGLLLRGHSLFVFLPYIILPLAVKLAKDFRETRGRGLNLILARTSFLGFVYTTLLALAVLFEHFSR
ncbi:MAG: 1,4-dihydroxy-2-naphthoate polyprenyltransferase [Spirochaetales bacterium]|nr:1,4-dihydroxy-2-naphthoate polyprenyltransferase [Spirochaetales bacterium]